MDYIFKGDNYNLVIRKDEKGVYFEKGNFGEIEVLEGPIFSAVLQNGEEKRELDSYFFKNAEIEKKENEIIIYFNISEITFIIRGKADNKGISFTSEVINNNENISVTDLTYTTPILFSEKFDLFEPSVCGRVVKDAGKRGYKKRGLYPGDLFCMEYFAVYGEKDGIYLGIEDADAAVKEISIQAGDKKAEFIINSPGINAGNAKNSFTLYGISRWEYIKGDWYDATMLYGDFVYKKAKWLPEIDLNGRTDTPKKFKELPFWVADYIPNSKSQGDNKPMNLSAGSDIYAPDYWIDAVIELKKELGVPLAYHVYNWHNIPFNIEYPHFMPAKDNFKEGLKRLKAEGIYVLPYINAVSWETRDGEMGHEINFENTGKHGAVIDKNGEMVVATYPQKTISGHKSGLAPICPSFLKWWEIIDDISREMEKELDIDGIYYDQISALSARPCYNKEHSHLPGGGCYWVEGYNKMMEKINAKKPEGSFYFSECNAEPYIKSFDGYLTWTWVENGEVPAFPAIYAGYIQMLGSFTIGKKKEDYNYFKYATAKAFLYGQQLGWCKADVIYSKERLLFLKKMVGLRYKYTELFNCSKMLRPPVIKSDLAALSSEPCLYFNEDIVMEQLLSGAWQYRNKEKTVIFLINTSEEKSSFTLEFNIEEYGLDLPSENGICTFSGEIEAYECKIWEF
ncbi:MAG: hypothetical protein IKZ25_03260 [Clostridia bacterium]|nr:hypothetical protein [Clostridia bacterium]